MPARILLALTLALVGFATRAASAPSATDLLESAVSHWLGERDRWAFTQRAVEYENGVPRERLERFDPSRPGNARWQLLAIDGRPPTREQHQKWAAKKFRRNPRRIDTPLSEFFDFDAARVVSETSDLARFQVPLRRDKSWLFPVEKVAVNVTVNKQTGALEHLSAHVREPFKVFLGLARITGGELDVEFFHFNAQESDPASVQPNGMARVSVTRFGERVEFTWTDFKRVTPYRGTAAAPGSLNVATMMQGVSE